MASIAIRVTAQVPELRRIEGKASDPENGTASGASASTAMRAMALRAERAERLDLAAAVRLARRAHLVRPRRLVTVRAEAQPRSRDAVLGAALVAARLGRFSLRDCHQRSRSIATPPFAKA
jgi:hypothetical protein